MPRGHWRAVLFDYFGTLTGAVRRGPAHTRMARRLGCAPDAWIAALNRTFRARATGALGDPIDVLHDLAVELGADPELPAVYHVYAARVAALVAEGRLRPESVPVLQAVRALGLRTAVLSDCWYELPLLLPTLPVYPLLDARVYSVQVGRCKPDPAMYLLACDRLGVQPAECLYVGDGGSRELTGAEAVGMTAVRLTAPDLADHLTFEPDLGWQGPTVTSLVEVLRLLRPAPVTV